MSPRKAAALPDGGNLREHLIATAARVIAERGTAGLTVRAIAREAGVADGVLYNHFADKEELLAYALCAHVGQVESELGELPSPGTATVEANLRRYVVHGLEMHRRIVPAFAGLISQPKVLAKFAELGEQDEDWRERLRGYLRAERDLGRLAPEAKVGAAARMIVGFCHESVMSAVFQSGSPGPVPSARAVDDLVEVVLHGIVSS